MKQAPKLIAVLAASAPLTAAVAAGPVVMHRDPGCGCCHAWVRQVGARFGRAVQIIDDADRASFRRSVGVPADFASCHTARIDGLIFEGHVPLAQIERVLAARPAGVNGLVVAGMPSGTPGMEQPGRRADPYDVIAFGSSGRRVYYRHPSTVLPRR